MMRRNVFLKPITLFVASMLFASPMAGLGHAASLQAGVMSLTIPEAADLTPTEAGLIKVQLSGLNADTDPDGTYVGAHGLRLPGTFKGTLPCADCDGIAHHLDLWPDGTYHMQRIWLGGEGNNQSDEIGRWFADPARQAIVLNGAPERPLQWQILGEDRLRQLAMDGTPIESTLNYELTNETGLDATDVEDVFLAGMARVSTERATFEDCLTGRLYDISVDGAWGDLASAYEADVDAADVPLFAQVEASLRMQGADAAGDGAEMVLGRLIETDPDLQCDRLSEQASLTDTYWRIDGLLDAAVAVSPDTREPYLVLLSGEGARYTASVGCNQISGRYDAESDTIMFGPAIMTRMACPPELDALEQRLQDVLARARSFRHENATLMFLDEAGQTIADLSAVAFR